MVQGERVELSLPPYQGGVITVILPLHNTENIWRRWRDSNPRAEQTAYFFSRETSLTS